RGSPDPCHVKPCITLLWLSVASYLERPSPLLVLSENHPLFFRPLIKEKLSQGVTLVMDRYAFSGVAFSGAKENFSLDWCKQPDVGLPKPDLVLFLQLQLADAAKRSAFGHERYENGAFQERALQCFHQLMRDTTVNWKVVDASKSIEAVHEDILVLSEDAIRTATEKPLGELWK
uniref:dTMP kinase n=1 Tax=Saimiri boliviensis boliviensis TaxID=39432 RepID=A0A2K6U5D6_SAIBB